MKSPITDEIRIFLKKEYKEHLECLLAEKERLENGEYYKTQKYVPVNAGAVHSSKARQITILCTKYTGEYSPLNIPIAKHYDFWTWCPSKILFEHCGDGCNAKTFKDFVLKKNWRRNNPSQK